MDDGTGYDFGQWLQNPVASFECVVEAVMRAAGHFYFGGGYLWCNQRLSPSRCAGGRSC